MIKNSLKTRLKGSRGITLIALVVSVIVLLILAGVSISAITGNESAMEKAKEARTANEAGGELDSVKLAVVSAMAKGTYGMVEFDKLNAELAGIGLSATAGTGDEAGYFIVNGTKAKYKISANGNVDTLSGATISQSTITFTEGGTNAPVTLTVSPTEGLTIKSVTWSVPADNGLVTISGASGTSTTVSKIAEPSKTSTTVKANVTTNDNKTHEVSCNVNYTETTVDTLTVTVSPEDTENAGKIKMAEGATGTITVVAKGKLESTITVTPSFNGYDTTIIEVASDGKVTAKKTGTTTITVSVGTKQVVVPVEITEAPEPEVTLGEVDTSTNATTGKNYAEMFGWNVNYVSRENKTDWKLFYRDNTNTYIISDSLVSSTVPSENYNSSATGASIGNVGRGLNPMVAEYFVAGNSWANLKGTAWFTKISNWTKYTDTAGNAKFAIASPTAELFQKSFNATHTGGNQITLGKGDYGYTQNTSSGWLKSTDNYGIYNKDGSTNWWLASPGSYRSDSCRYVSGSNGYFNNDSIMGCAFSLRPLVCIQNSVFDGYYSITQP